MRGLLHDLAMPGFRRLADRWGYDVRGFDLEMDGMRADARAQRAKWAKIDLMRTALQEFPLALWLDADVLVTRTDDDVSAHLHGQHFQALALEHVPAENRVNPNTGVWLMRSCPSAFEFLDAVETAGIQPGPWADQGAVLAALGWDRGDERYHGAVPGPGSRFLAGTSWLPAAWNQPYVEGRTAEDCYNGSVESYFGRPIVSDPFVIHFMGMTPDARRRHMSRVAASLPPDSARGMRARRMTATGRFRSRRDLPPGSGECSGAQRGNLRPAARRRTTPTDGFTPPTPPAELAPRRRCNTGHVPVSQAGLGNWQHGPRVPVSQAHWL